MVVCCVMGLKSVIAPPLTVLSKACIYGRVLCLKSVIAPPLTVLSKACIYGRVLCLKSVIAPPLTVLSKACIYGCVLWYGSVCVSAVLFKNPYSRHYVLVVLVIMQIWKGHILSFIRSCSSA